MKQTLFDLHREKFEAARSAIRTRTYQNLFPDDPRNEIYGESAEQEGLKAYERRLDRPFKIDQPGTIERVGAEVSPYTGRLLGVTYPKPSLDLLLDAAQAALPAWRDLGITGRVGVCLEMLARLNQHSFEIANAVMHTTGQAFPMAFQAGGAHAQERGLEALAYAYDEMIGCPRSVESKNPARNAEYPIRSRGVAAVIGCSTFPLWNGYPGLFASLATGNAVVIKPHPLAILPFAITVEIVRNVLKEQSIDPNLVNLAADTLDDTITMDLVRRDEIRIIDYTGRSEFGNRIEETASQAVVFTETSAVNSIILDSVTDLISVTENLAMSISLYSGQMCTSPQNIFVPAEGIDVGGEKQSFDSVVHAIVNSVDKLLGVSARAINVLGAIQNTNTLERLEKMAIEGGEVVRPSEPIVAELFPDACIRSPLIITVDAKEVTTFMREVFGPIQYIVRTSDTNQSIELAAKAARTLGAMTCGVYSTSSAVLMRAVEIMMESGVSTWCNLTGRKTLLNQARAFSDYHGTSTNPAGNAVFCNNAFVAPRFTRGQWFSPV